jgi:DNA processing protein
MSAPLVALAGLPGMGPARLRVLLEVAEPEQAWAHVRCGTVADLGVDLPASLLDRWRHEASVLDVAALWEAHVAAGVRVLGRADPAFPAVLAEDPEPPSVLFVRGSLDALRSRRVAVVGTRRCTWAGRQVSFALGRDLAAAGVCVVSGLALGIDGEAHRGALRGGAPPVAVVGTGLDVVYPRRHAELWDAVGRHGAIVSEYPLGTRAERWRFPARHRFIAALAEVVVVVESSERGGSLHTVDAALERDRTVLAVPGPVRSPASTGTNGLLAAGCPPCRDEGDVLVALGLTPTEAASADAPPPRPADDDEARILDALGWEPATLDELAERIGAPLGPVALHLTRLANAGWVVQRSGWWERAR